MPAILKVSHSASPSALSTLSKLSEQRVQLGYDRRTRRHWEAVFASFILIASFVTVILLITTLNLNMSSENKPYKGSRQRGPFGLRKMETLKPAGNGDEPLQVTEDLDNPMNQEGADITGPNGGPKAQSAQDQWHSPSYPDVEPIEEVEYEDEKLRAPSLKESGDNGEKCNTPLCQSLKQWFQKTVGRQADPCKERNTFVCDPALPLPGFKSPLAKPQRLVRSKPRDAHTTDSQHYASNVQESANLLHSCLEYTREPNASLDDLLLFMSHLNLDLRDMVDDQAEDPLARMMELSLDYGVDAPVSFVRQYDVTRDASAPYVIKITLNPEVKDFFNSFRSLEEDDILSFYQFFLKTYARLKDYLLAEQLVNADDELSDFLNKTGASSMLSTIQIPHLAEATGVTTDQWKQLLVSFGRSSEAVFEEVIAEEQALSFVAYLSRPLERIAMRRMLAWHVLRYMMSPTTDIRMASTKAQDEGLPFHSLFQPRHPETKCTTMLARLKGVPFTALSLWEGNGAVPTAAIVDVARFMGKFQDSLASVFRSVTENRSELVKNGNTTASEPASSKTSKVALFPSTAGRRADSVSLFDALDGENESIWHNPATSRRSFVFRWLRHLRAWYAMPPLVQILLPRMASAAHEDTPEAFFRPPYYDANAPPEYTFSTLGQVISKAMAHELAERRHRDPSVGKRWRDFWAGLTTVDRNSVYCLLSEITKNGTWRENRLDESKFTDKVLLDGVLSSRIAYLSFLRAQRQSPGWMNLTETLLDIGFSSKQVFFVMHCTFSCSLGRRRDLAPGTAPQRCMVAYKPGRRSISTTCRQLTRRNVPNECYYL